MLRHHAALAVPLELGKVRLACGDREGSSLCRRKLPAGVSFRLLLKAIYPLETGDFSFQFLGKPLRMSLLQSCQCSRRSLLPAYRRAPWRGLGFGGWRTLEETIFSFANALPQIRGAAPAGQRRRQELSLLGRCPQAWEWGTGSAGLGASAPSPLPGL